jgi:hypothetical protein
MFGDRTYEHERVILRAMQARVLTRQRRRRFTLGHPTVSENPGLPIFSSLWELRGAVQVVMTTPQSPAIRRSRLGGRMY